MNTDKIFCFLKTFEKSFSKCPCSGFFHVIRVKGLRKDGVYEKNITIKSDSGFDG